MDLLGVEETINMDILHKNTDPDMLSRLKTLLEDPAAATADIAVGYFFMSGFDAVADQIASLDSARILVGRTDRQIIEEVALGLQQANVIRERSFRDSSVRRGEREPIALQSVQSIATGTALLPQTAESQAAVNKLRDLVEAKKVEIKAYPEGVLHAKAYICHMNGALPGAAIVGSSNFTLAGLTGNTELNVEVEGPDAMGKLSQWFEDLWAKSVDVSEALIEELNRSWALATTPPYHVYLKALYEIHSDEIDSGVSLIPSDRVHLADFQRDAVNLALRMIETYGGCYVGDVVGTGKTFIGAEILRQMRLMYPLDGPPLIICPAGLKPMWERTIEEFAIGATVLSMSVVTSNEEGEYDEEEGRILEADPSNSTGVILSEAYPNRGPVLVDEAHNFRNINKRYRGLLDYLEQGDHRVVLMSATPQNLGPRDIYRQLRLFLGDEDHGLKINPNALDDFFNSAERWYEFDVLTHNYALELNEWQRNGRKGAGPDAPTPPRGSRANLQDALLPVFIRRRRKDITELYPNAEINGKRVVFPEPKLSNTSYRLDNVYKKAGSFDEIAALLKDLTSARYRPADFLTVQGSKKDEYRDILRARNRIAGLMATLVVKRLESSVAAFRSTVLVLIQSNRNFRSALVDGYVPVGSTATRLLKGESFDPSELLDILSSEENRLGKNTPKARKLVHSASDFDVENWCNALDQDYQILAELRDRIEHIGPSDDDKLTALKNYLSQPGVTEEKVLIFSESAVTVDYLYSQLNPGDRDNSIERVSSNSSTSTATVVKRFAPEFNLLSKEKIPGPEIRVLITTDRLAEGQNLQSCGRVLNYDLHWNPVRLIQRFGRVDRVGSEHNEVFLSNMWPDLAVDSTLSLTDRLVNRIQMIHDIIGLDSQLLSQSERINEEAMYRIYEEQRLPDEQDGLDEVAEHQRGIALLQRLREEDENLWETIINLPDGIRSALTATVETDRSSTSDAEREFIKSVIRTEDAQVPLTSQEFQHSLNPSADGPNEGDSIVMLESGGVKQCYAIGDTLEPREITLSQFVSAAACNPDTPPRTLPETTNARVTTAFDHFEQTLRTRVGRAKRPGYDRQVRRYIRRELRIVASELRDNSDMLKRIEILRRIFSENPVLGQADLQLESIRKESVQGEALIRRLEVIRQHYRLNPPGEDVRAESSEVIRVVCSDGLLASTDDLQAHVMESSFQGSAIPVVPLFPAGWTLSSTYLEERWLQLAGGLEEQGVPPPSDYDVDLLEDGVVTEIKAIMLWELETGSQLCLVDRMDGFERDKESVYLLARPDLTSEEIQELASSIKNHL